MINNLRNFFEKYGFDVSTRLAERFGIRVGSVRLFFIYFTFFTFGISFALYIVFAFLLKLKDMVYMKRKSVFDL